MLILCGHRFASVPGGDPESFEHHRSRQDIYLKTLPLPLHLPRLFGEGSHRSDRKRLDRQIAERSRLSRPHDNDPARLPIDENGERQPLLRQCPTRRQIGHTRSIQASLVADDDQPLRSQLDPVGRGDGATFAVDIRLRAELAKAEAHPRRLVPGKGEIVPQPIPFAAIDAEHRA